MASDLKLIYLLKSAFQAGVNHGTIPDAPAFEQWVEDPTIAQLLKRAEMTDQEKENEDVFMIRAWFPHEAIDTTWTQIQAENRGKLPTVDVPMITDSLPQANVPPIKATTHCNYCGGSGSLKNILYRNEGSRTIGTVYDLICNVCNGSGIVEFTI